MGLGPRGYPSGHFMAIELSNGVTLDYGDRSPSRRWCLVRSAPTEPGFYADDGA